MGDVLVVNPYRGIPDLKTWNAPVVGDVTPIARCASNAMTRASR